LRGGRIGLSWEACPAARQGAEGTGFVGVGASLTTRPAPVAQAWPAIRVFVLLADTLIRLYVYSSKTAGNWRFRKKGYDDSVAIVTCKNRQPLQKKTVLKQIVVRDTTAAGKIFSGDEKTIL